MPFHISRYALSISAAAMLAGCGGSQPPIGGVNTMPQSRAIAQHAARTKSWMALGLKQHDLLYVVSNRRVDSLQILAM
jgi:hypothetical protein